MMCDDVVLPSMAEMSGSTERRRYVCPGIRVKEIHCGMVMGSTVDVRFDIDVPKTNYDETIYIEI